jgi:hypothetical protein
MSKTMALRSVGSSFDNYLKEEDGLFEEVTKRVLERLENYGVARERERYAIALTKTYAKRRQIAYREYLKEFDSLQNQFNEKVRRVIARRLNEIHQRFDLWR